MTKTKIWPYLFAALVTATLFGFVDSKYRGWWDTNQYQIEAKLWSHGQRPPSPAISYSFDLPNSVGPRHTTPLMPWIWGALANPSSWNDSLVRIRILQVFLIGFCTLGLLFLLRRREATVGSLFIVLLLFTNSFFRDLTMHPITEPLALSLLIASMIWPRFVGIGMALEFLIRPMVLIFFVPTLIRNYRSKFVWITLVGTLGLSALYFKSLIEGSPANDMHLEFWKAYPVFTNFAEDAAHVYLAGLPHKGVIFNWAWQIILASAALALLIRHRRRYDVLICTIIYYLFTMVPLPISGVRYLFPLILFWLAELKPQVSRSWVVRGGLIFLVCFSIGHRFENIRDFRGLDEVDTDSKSSQGTRSWLKENQLSQSTIMMHDYRLCINYFDTLCIPIPASDTDLPSYLIKHHVQFIYVSGLHWHQEEKAFELWAKPQLKKAGLDYDAQTKTFGISRLVDVRPLTK